MLLTTQGRLLGCGKNDNAELGLGHTQNQMTFVEIPLVLNPDEQVVEISACAGSLLATNQGRVFAAGANTAYQFGSGYTNPQNHFVLIPLALNSGEKVVLVSSKWCQA